MAGLFKKCRHPLVSFTFFVMAVCSSLIFKHPLFLAVSLIMALTVNLYLRNFKLLKSLLYMVPVFAFLGALNPVVSHYGKTVLFNLFANPQRPVTLEALVYGLNSALLMLTVTVWCLAFSKVMTSEKLTFLFAPFFPALSVMFVMILRLIPFYGRRAAEISDGRKGLGLEKGNSLWQKIKEKFSVMNAVTSSVLEDGRCTADSMVERGWGSAKRSCFAGYVFGFKDFVFLVLMTGFMALNVFCAVKGCGFFDAYGENHLELFMADRWNLIGLGSNVLLMVLGFSRAQ